MIIVSACLAGKNCQWNGGNSLKEDIRRMVECGKARPLCPEELGGLGTPRELMEIKEGSGEDVLEGRAKVVTQTGKDVSQKIIKGAKEVLRAAREVNATCAILKARSPACGLGRIYDGTFTKTLRPGNGVTAALLLREGIPVVSEEEAWRKYCDV